ncbi:conserved phage C-terminal domain-containing protein [Ligilactobacillus salivarius]|uniref:conserved phage C-terminal domain-containing protein n=1 Tax=Ligilactobacillus salivarius TaxID=1624 RepID=UPI0023B058F7|nr:conserved phage C-terminal domain-containing protein [Ligilactobacillus salivarius]MDE7522892.1 conserved phage C-terminal domain-containing protein [Ligilactobacillus salivarius]
MEEKPSYYSILTADVRYNKKLNASEKLLFSEITALSNKYGYCVAGNGYFSKLYNVSDRSVTRWIKHLKELGYLKYVPIYKKDSKEVDERRLYPLTNSKEPLDKNVYGGRQKCPRPLDKNVEDNITSINNINTNNDIKENSNKSNSNNKDNFDYKKFIEWFNELADKNFRNAETNRKLIRARLNEGYTKEDIAKVVQYKVGQWKDNTKMNKYLRFTTLFAPTNFSNYLQEVEDSSPEPQKKKEKSSAKREKRKDPIEEKIYQYQLFLQEHPDDEDVRKELEQLERNRTENSGDVA